MTLHLTAGSGGDGQQRIAVTPEGAGWQFAGLRVFELAAGAVFSFATGSDEAIVLPLAGACRVDCEGDRFELVGRASVFTGASDFAYLPSESSVQVSSGLGGRFAIATARSRQRLAPRIGLASEVAVEVRGAGRCTRLVRNFCMPATFPADRLIACEVVTPAGNWSSYPPHKHDEERLGESVLEEIYYFEIGRAGDGGASVSRAGFGFQRAYGTPDRPLDLLAEVRTGDVVLIPHGWHGPSMAAPGYDMYYLNVMAGPGPERQWLACDDPAHEWVRDSWRDEEPDPRLVRFASKVR